MATVDYLLFFGIVLMLAFSYANCQQQNCPTGWYYYGQSCYALGQEVVTWADAAEICKLYNAYLAEIDFKEENDFVKSIFLNKTSLSSGCVWIGGTDIYKEGEWIWLNSKVPILEFSDWYPGEPNQLGTPGGEDCLQYFRSEQWKWNDEDCDTTGLFICELELSSPIG